MQSRINHDFGITSTTSKSYLSFALLAANLLRLYVLWDNQHGITRFDIIMLLCVCVHVLVAMLPNPDNPRQPDSTMPDLNHGTRTSQIAGDTLVEPREGSDRTSLTHLSGVFQKRLATTEVVGIASVLRLCWNPHDRSSIWFSWTPIFAGLFVATAQFFILTRTKKPSVTAEDFIMSLVGMWIAFLA